MSRYTVHMRPPTYPKRCFPGRCRHEPQFVMQHDVHIVRKKRVGNQIEVDHAVCLACGMPQPCTIGGNVLVDLHMLWLHLGWHAVIGARIQHLRERWARLAAGLFDENGWNGRHERIARLIDPPLTMRIFLERPVGPVRIGTFRFDPSLVRNPEARP